MYAQLTHRCAKNADSVWHASCCKDGATGPQHMRPFEQRNRYFDQLCNTPGLMWLGQNTNHFDPHPSVLQAVADALKDGSYHAYAPPCGFEELRQLILDDLGLPEACAFVTDGGVEALFNVCSNICKPGKDFVTTDPSWAWPMHFARKFGSNVVE